jgi:hypothetical protein
MSVHKAEAEQARANTLKIIRAAVRLKHSINADNELNVVLPEAEMRFDSAIQRGRIPSSIEIKRAVGL